MKGLIVYAPDGSGIEERAREIADYKGLSHVIVDSGSFPEFLEPPINTLVITHFTGIAGALDYSDVLDRMVFHSMSREKRLFCEQRNALLFPYVRYSSADLARLVALPGWLRCVRRVYVRLFGWLGAGVRARLGIR